MLMACYFPRGADLEKRCLLCVNQHLTEPLPDVPDQPSSDEEYDSDDDTSDLRSTTNPHEGVSPLEFLGSITISMILTAVGLLSSWL